jgi:putative methionine-R-sulfoxide reductase with GAF domain
VLDVDSSQLSTFDATDQRFLEEITGWLRIDAE